MRFRHLDGSVVHLAYCSNVHAAEDVDGLTAQLHRYAGPLRQMLGAGSLGIGLWIAAPALEDLLASGPHPGPAGPGLGRLRAELHRLGLEVVTLNGFPYRSFHAPVVKHSVYSPDWSAPERASYTMGLAQALVHLLPDDISEGSISTLPLGWREGWNGARHDAARRSLDEVARSLAGIAAVTGKTIRLGLEPEPGCVIERVEQAAEVLADADSEWIGLCLDACHLAVGFEDPAAAVACAASAGLRIVKAQVSSALRVRRPQLPGERRLLESFVEPRFLHQVREATPTGTRGVDDLDQALGGGLPGISEWRVHFHVPIHTGGDRATGQQLRETLHVLLSGGEPVTRHLEVETYTWSVLPTERRPMDEGGLVCGLASELVWARHRLGELGLEEIS